MKKVLITGITGQAGSYLAELLLAKGYDVYGMMRLRQFEAEGDGGILKPVTDPLRNIRHIESELHLLWANLRDQGSIEGVVSQVMPDELYHLAAEQVVERSWDDPVTLSDINAMGAVRVLDAVRKYSPKTRLLWCSSSEIFGRVSTAQNEDSRLNPVNPYAVCKTFGHHMARVYRESYNLPISIAIPFSMESPRRPEHFVTRKITRAAAAIKLGMKKDLTLGNIESKRDFGYCADSVEAMWRILQDKPDDYVIATGKSRSVQEFLEAAFSLLDLDWRRYVKYNDQAHLRPVDMGYLCGDATKICRDLGWKPRVTFEELVKIMVTADLESLRASK